MQTNRFLRIAEVRTRTGLATSTIYRKVSEGEFPPPVKLGARASGWVETQVNKWIDEKINASRAA